MLLLHMEPERQTKNKEIGPLQETRGLGALKTCQFPKTAQRHTKLQHSENASPAPKSGSNSGIELPASKTFF